MKVLSLFISIALITLTTSTLLDEGLKSSEGFAEPYTCKSRLIEFFIDVPDTDDYQSIVSTKNMLEICPTLDQSCCNEEVLTALKNNFLQGKEALWQILSTYEDALKTFNLKMKLIKNLTSETNIKIIKNCMGSDNVFSLGSFIKRIENEGKNYITEINTALNNVSKFYSGFACEVCSERYAQSFSVDSDMVWLHYDTTNVHSMYERTGQLYTIYKFVLDFSRIGKAAYCLKHDSAEIFGTNVDDDNYNKNQELIKGCIDLTPEAITNDNKCLMIIKKMGYTHNFRSLDQTYNLLDLTKNALQGLDEDVSKPSNVISTNDNFIVFYPLNERSSRSFNDVKIKVGVADGIKIVDNPMKIDLWKNASMFRVVFACLLTLLLH